MDKDLLVPHSQFLSLVYHDLFDYPLTREELEFWQIGSQVFPKHKIGRTEIFCYLPGRPECVLRRVAKGTTNTFKYSLAQRAARALSIIPTIELVGVSGALAMGNAKDEDDIDLFIIASVDCLWITRLVSLLLLKFLHIPVRRFGDANVKNKLCLNLWLDKKNLGFSDKQEIYTAHEVLQMKVLFDRGGIGRKFLEANNWVEQFFPVGFRKALSVSEGRKWTVDVRKPTDFLVVFMRIFEAPARIIQWLRMSKRRTREVVEKGRALFHPLDWRETVPHIFLLRLKKLSREKQIFASTESEILS